RPRVPRAPTTRGTVPDAGPGPRPVGAGPAMIIAVRSRTVGPILLVVAVVLAACSGGSGDADEAVGSTTPTGAGPGAEAACDWSIEAPSTTFIVDRCGRAVILRGVNVESSSKGDAQDDDHLPSSDPELQAMFG